MESSAAQCYNDSITPHLSVWFRHRETQCKQDDVIHENTFHMTDPSGGETKNHRWDPPPKKATLAFELLWFSLLTHVRTEVRIWQKEQCAPKPPTSTPLSYTGPTFVVGQTLFHETLPRQLGIFCPNHLNSSMAPIQMTGQLRSLTTRDYGNTNN